MSTTTLHVRGPMPAIVLAMTTWAVPALAQQSGGWAAMPRMQLERQYAGPLQDTIIQRWRDPVDGTICYVYLPITVQHAPPTPQGYVQYGANQIGSISCHPPQTAPSPVGRVQRGTSAN